MRLLLVLAQIAAVVVLLCAARNTKNKGLPSRMSRQVRNKRQNSGNSKWTNATVHYTFDCSFGGDRAFVKETLRVMSERTCLKFIESDQAENVLNIVDDGGCWSWVGMDSKPGWQDLSLGEGCVWFPTITHEFLHALGFEHTENRYDRDLYLWKIIEGDEYCDRIGIDGDEAGTAEVCPYDLGSVMHGFVTICSNASNSAGLPKWLPRRPEFMDTLGAWMASFYDYESVNKMYGCYDRCSKEQYDICQNGGKPNPNDCGRCNCPLGYGGLKCDEAPGETYTATKDWQNATIAITESEPGIFFTISASEMYYKSVWITRPDDTTTIEMQLLSMPEVDYVQGCWRSGVEFKVDQDVANTSPRYCRNEKGKVLETNNNPLAVVAYKMDPGEHTVNFQYRLKP